MMHRRITHRVASAFAIRLMRKVASKFKLTWARRESVVRGFYIATMLVCLPLGAYATPFDSGITQIQGLFTGTIAKASSVIAIVIGGYTFAHGDPGAKKNLAGIAAGAGIAVMSVNVLNWLWPS